MIYVNNNRDKTMDEYIKIYESKTKDKFIPAPGFKMMYLPNRGFCEVKVDMDKKMITAYQLCGDLLFWFDLIKVMARTLGIPRVGTFLIRDNPRAYIRLLGYTVKEVLPQKDEEGKIIEGYLIENKEGMQGRLTPCYLHQDRKRISYLITFGVNKDDEI